jgi:hypothetical protein
VRFLETNLNMEFLLREVPELLLGIFRCLMNQSLHLIFWPSRVAAYWLNLSVMESSMRLGEKPSTH